MRLSIPAFGVCIAFVLGFAGLTASPATAQVRPWQPQQPNAPTQRFSGTIKAVSGTTLQVVGDSGEQWLVAPRTPRVFSYSGTADSSWLQPGMWVRFDCRFDKKGKAQGAVEEISVFTPRAAPQPNRPGERPQQPPNDAERIGIFADTGIGGADLFADEGVKKGNDIQNYHVAGRIQSIAKGKMAVQAGNTAVQVDVSDKAKVDVRVDESLFIREGDKVVIEGWAHPQQKGQVLGNRLTVTAGETLTAEVAKPKKPVPVKPAKTEGKTEGKPEGKTEKGKPDDFPF